jgi:hypothetical protein
MRLFSIPRATMRLAQAIHDGHEPFHLTRRLATFDHFGVIHDKPILMTSSYLASKISALPHQKMTAH